MKVLMIILALMLSTVLGRSHLIDVSIPQSKGEVNFELGDTITFSNGISIEVRRLEALQTEGSIYTNDIYFAVIDSQTTATYLNDSAQTVNEWYQDSSYGVYNGEPIPYLNTTANSSQSSAWDSLAFPEHITIDSFLILDTIGDSLKLNRVVPGHYIATVQDYWQVSIVETIYPKTYGDMVYLQKKDKSSAVRFRLKELKFIEEEDGLHDFSQEKTINWEVDSGGNGIFKGAPTSIVSKKHSVGMNLTKSAVTIYSLNGRYIKQFESHQQYLHQHNVLPKGIYLLKNKYKVQKVVIH